MSPSLFAAAPLAAFMLVVALGFALGRAEWRGLGLGPAGGTMAVALAAGAMGLDFDVLYRAEEPRLTLGSFGFALFIYSVGFEAGPRFFAALRDRHGWRLVSVGVLVNVFALGATVLGARMLDLSPSIAAGILAGALTSAPTYAAAAEVCADPASLSLVFALTFPIGLVGLVTLTQVLPRAMGDDLRAGEAEAEGETVGRRLPVLRRAFAVKVPEALGRTLAELAIPAATGCRLVQIHRGPQVLAATAESRLRQGDHVMAEGRLDGLRELERRIGPEVYDDELRRRLPSPRAIVVTAPEVLGKSLRELPVLRQHHCLVTQVQRHDVALEPTADLQLERDDVVLAVGRRDDLRRVADRLGHFERTARETDLAVYAGGIFLGLLLGWLADRWLHLEAYAAGLLATGVLLGRFRRIGRWSAHVPAAARQLVRDLGILLFVAETGVAAGGQPFAGVGDRLGELLAVALLVLVVAVVGAVTVGRRLLLLRPVEAWGSVAGGMTSSSALAALRRMSESSEPAVAYTAAYAVGTVFATLAGRWVVTLLGTWA